MAIAQASPPEPEVYSLAAPGSAAARSAASSRSTARTTALRGRVPVPGSALPLPLGDLEAATPICNACTATHIFRADED